jgi:DNA (cytosine-5)-methyltransferase 1
MENKIKVVELFAGVGGFVLDLKDGMENLHHQITKKFKILTKLFGVINGNHQQKFNTLQLVYENRFGKNGHSNEDIAQR